MTPLIAALLSCLLIQSSAPAPTANWPAWRGAEMNGVSAAKHVPTEWSAEKNVRWKTPMPCWAGATPIVWGDRIFVLTPAAAAENAGEVGRQLPRNMGGRESPGGRDILLLCISADKGEILWQVVLDSRNALYGKQNMASPSPVTDGKHVWAMTGSGVLTCLDFEGKAKWRVDLAERFGALELLWGYASSPLLLGDQVIVQVLHGGARVADRSKTGSVVSYLAAFDASSGALRWKQDRTTDAANECPDAYTSPVAARRDGRIDVIVSGGDYVTGHDPANGRERWRAGGLNPEKQGDYRICPTPLVAGDLIIAGSRKKPMLALRGGGDGDVTSSHLAWKLERGGPDVPSPVSDGKLVFVVEDRGMVTCLDLKNGEIVWGPERTATGPVSASPVLADGRLYVLNEFGIMTVLDAGRAFKVLATNELEGTYTISSPAIVDGRIYLRTSKFLYCIENTR
ncbi:MAG: PQQ-binding-like beta-propeller repeat protein [Planctomycetes bacterium]|nr:PQQ-binding-like beta-propeller repeat protein [Planctomycetota bacterium]